MSWLKDQTEVQKAKPVTLNNTTNTNVSKPIEVDVVQTRGKKRNNPTKVKIKKRGRLDEREMVEIKKTNTSMMSWVVRKMPKPVHMPLLELDDMDMDWEDRDREEKLAMVERKKLEWAATRMCRSVLLDMVKDSVMIIENKHLVVMMAELVDEAWRRLEVTRLIGEIIECEQVIQQRVEVILSSRRAEEMELIAAAEKEEVKERRLKRIAMIKQIWKKKAVATNLRKMLRMLRKLTLEELEMEIDEIELKTLEMMEDQMVDDDQMELEEIEELEIQETGQRESKISPSFVNGRKEHFGDVATMLDFWERLEKEEPTPIQEKVLVRRRSARLESVVEMLGVEQDRDFEMPNYTMKGENNIFIKKSSNSKPQTSIYLGSREKRKRESCEGLTANKRKCGFGASN